MEIDNEVDLIRLNRNMIDHVFLHRRLPGKPIDLHQTESSLLKLMTATVESYDTAIFPTAAQRLFTNMKQLHCMDALEPKAISEQMAKLKSGDMLGIYVREQNCGLFIHMDTDDDVTLSTFSASLPNEIVYGDNINSDIQVDYPTRAVKVKLSKMLRSKEFAKQIHFLNSNQMNRAMSKSRKAGRDFSEQRNVPQPMYISQWLVAVASSRYTEVNDACPVISKKLRDEVIMGQENLPFRRSGFYTSMKMFLQLALTIELGNERGKFLYKLILLKFMCKLCNDDRSIDDDILMQMMAKMARRIDKIENCSTSAIDLGSGLLQLKDMVIEDAKKTVHVMRKNLNDKFEAIQSNEHRLSERKALPRLQFERDIIHQIPKLSRYLEVRNAKIVWEVVDNFPRPRPIIRHTCGSTAPDVDQLNKISGEIETLQLLADWEHWILLTPVENWYQDTDISRLRQLANAYMLKAQSFYQSDCFGYSKMVLVMLKIIQIMDMVAAREHRVLLSHSSGINPKMIENLLLSSQFHLRIARELQTYFEDRNSKAQYPGLLEENIISTSSFSVRFAENDYQMQRIRDDILAMGERRVEEKRFEWWNARDAVDRMRKRASKLSHHWYSCYWRYPYHNDPCEKCKLEKEIRDYRVEIYEKPLRPEIHNQNAVVFELWLPKKIECLRDVLHLFVTQHYESPSHSVDVVGKWTEYEQISEYNCSHPENVFLGSTTELVKKSHYGEPKHPDQPFEEFIVENGYNCTFYSKRNQTLPIDRTKQSVKKHVTFSVQSNSVYSGLQWTLKGTDHTQNSVLTKQNECPQKMSLNEFINFGSLRADGHRLHLRNLYRALETEGLSFETQSVLALVMQSLWEAGPLDAASTQWYRESHEDFADEVFSMAMLELLEKYVYQQESNWKHPLRLIAAVTIAVKMFEINSDEANADRIVKLLIYIRKIAINWISLIIETIGRCHDETSRSVVYANLVEVAICGAFTYNVNRHHQFFDKIFVESSDNSSLFAWLQFMVTINNNSLLRGGSYSGIIRLLIRMVYNIGINAEVKLKSLIANNPDEVHKFVRCRWSDSRTQTFEPIQWCSHSPQILFMAVRSEHYCNYVQINLISGDFLVNNLPVARLPNSITDHSLFRRVFGNTVFEVQPSNRSFSTVYQYNGFNYIFRVENGLLIITEQNPNGNDRELIPTEYLFGEIPYLLVENHSHWYDKGRKTIEFRPKTFGTKDFSTPCGVQYEMNLNTRQLKHLKMQKFMLDICSDSYQQIIKFLSRLEQKDYIHVLMDAPAKAKVHLMRMNLKFVIDCTEATEGNTYDVESNEYCGMRVSLNQTFGTLIGLQNGLMLESIPTLNKSNSKLFVVPHGTVSIESANRHVSVCVQLDHSSLRSPTFFIFQVDDECKYIKANNYQGWFYLAYLHAVTSHPLSDPFTGMTGTERALKILQSARVWSCSSYDGESMSTLQMISALTPKRTFYPAHLRAIQQVQWPNAISSAAAQDAYRFIVQKLSSGYSQSYTVLDLNKRDHARHAPFNLNCNVSEAFVPTTTTSTRFEATEDDINVSAVRQLSTVYDEDRFVIPSNVKDTVYNLLTGKQTLKGVSDERITNIIEFSSSADFPNLWIRLYDRAHLQQLTPEDFQLILTFLAYEGNDINHLYILQAIAANPLHFQLIHPPEFKEYFETGRHEFEDVTVKKIIGSTEIGLEAYLKRELKESDDEEEEGVRKRRKYDLEQIYIREVAHVAQTLFCHIKSNWPCDEVGYISLSSDKLNVQKSIAMINPILRMWNNNRKLVLFLREVEAKLASLHVYDARAFLPDPWPIFHAGEKPFRKYKINFDEKLSRQFMQPLPAVADDIKRAQGIFIDKIEDEGRTLAEWWKRFEEISTPSNEMHLVHAGLYPHLMPSLILPKLLHPIACDGQKCMIGALAVLTTREQRTQRIRRFEHQPQMELSLRRENENQPHVNWIPQERPEWLMFEIEMNLSIRRIQVEIAERMMEPPGHQHSVMQLNMGEGKTAVIVPILATLLANGKQLCVVTVLKSLFQTNQRSLRQCLGGMLNQRVYTFPCRRDMHTEADLLSKYEECMRERGVVITLPEYRLSFQLKIYEAARKGDTANATNFLKVHDWLNRNARHIMDESDAILDAKYQLIYTVGAQLPPDAGALRWTIIQAVLKRIPHHMRRLFHKYGDQAIEFDENYQIGGIDYGRGDVANRPEVFRPCRLLDERIYNELADALIDDFLDGEMNILFPETTSAVREQIRQVLRDPNISQSQHTALMDRFEQSPQKSILILSGLFKFGVLKLSLMKRWRVQYGVNSNGWRKMAVPFRAKDVAAEMTEFGHPDVAICLTHFSYYYSGLTDGQLNDTFSVLGLTQNPEEIYQDWIRSVPKHLIPTSIASYSGINLSDPGQRDIVLFPLLRYNMHVIDYWLSKMVFPREAKIFEGKLMCSAWDLCTEHFEHIVTGFSGTNDTKLVLPMPIVQNDLPELEKTNENVRQILLREENNYYHRFASNVSGMEILKKLAADGIPVLLDSGALMLELDNEQAAREWLKLVSMESYDAAIFLSKDDILMTIDRNDFIIEFEYSVYRERLNRCLVYLDDIHTRGTDLKFPSGIRACVTLSGRITRDKVVQACMRMRMLGQGHMVSFWASLEADIGIREVNGLAVNDGVNTSHVIKYICENSQKFEKDGLVHWAAAGFNYAQKLAVHKLIDTSNALNLLGERCTDPENTPLAEMYGAKVIEALTIITRNRFDRLAHVYNEEQAIFEWINKIGDGVVSKLETNIPDVVRYTQLLDEEQEKELEHELEEQREVARPPSISSKQPYLNPLLRDLFMHGQSHTSFIDLKQSEGIRKMPLALARTKIFSIMEPQLTAWADNVFATTDFMSVAVLSANDRDDEFIRPVWWIARVIEPNNTDVFVLLSPFECNALLSTFRSSKKSILHMFCPKLSLPHSNLLNDATLQIPANSPNECVALIDAVQIDMFAGSMYFNDRHEEATYCHFMGFIPRPRSEEYQRAFDEGAIRSNGYVPIEHRHRFAELTEACRFIGNSDEIAIGIIERRHGYLRANSHVSSVLIEGKRVRWDN